MSHVIVVGGGADGNVCGNCSGKKRTSSHAV